MTAIPQRTIKALKCESMAKEIEQLDNEQLNLKLKEWLQSAPLYTEYRYTGGNALRLPDEIELFCEQCKRETSWRKLSNPQAPNDKLKLVQRSYRCSNDKEQQIHFAYSWYDDPLKVDGKTVTVFAKYGQSPPLEERISKELEKALEGTDDLKFYKKALRLRNFDNGIGSMAYLRRVIENHMGEMLEILNDEAKAKGLKPMTKEEIRALKFSQKIDRAKDLFPAVITPENHPNPFEWLHKLTSDGLHNLSEAESIVLFDQCKNVFEYVFSEMRPHLGTRKKFLEDLQRLPTLGSAASEKKDKPTAPANNQPNVNAQKAG